MRPIDLAFMIFWLQKIGTIGVILVFIPLLIGLVWVFEPILDITAWQHFFSDQRILPATVYTVLSALGSSALALAMSLTILIGFYPSRQWQRIQAPIPILLALPHTAFAIGLAFLIAPSGWFARIIAQALDWVSPPLWVTVHDPYALTLTIALAIKESWFLLWVLAALLGQQSIHQQLQVGLTLGYSRWKIWFSLLLPQLLPQLAWPFLAILAYSLSVVDMAQILGPSNPSTLAVLSWQWLSDPNEQIQAKGSIGALLITFILLAIIATSLLLHTLYQHIKPYPSGIRRKQRYRAGVWFATLLSTSPGWLSLIMLVMWACSGAWFFPDWLPNQWTLSRWGRTDYQPLITTLHIGISCVLIALPIVLLWLEYGPKHQEYWVYLPLILPALPLAAAQYSILLHSHQDGTLAGVIWSHLAWVIPYMLLVLMPPYRAIDPRIEITALTLGKSQWRSVLWVKWPILLRPILAACAIGFSVSVALYLPTLFAGGGRFETVTTEAVALSSGGNRRTLAIQALLQALLPMIMFALAALAFYPVSRKYKGLQ